MSVTCTPSSRTARAAYWVVRRGAYACVLHIERFLQLVRPRPLWVTSKGIGRGEGSGRRENVADRAGRSWQTGQQGTRPTTNYVEPRCFCCTSGFLSFPFDLGRTLFSRHVRFRLQHLRGGTTPPNLFYFILFERSEFLIATCKKKKTDRLSVVCMYA